MATKIDTDKARKELEARRNPYWHKLSGGRYVGYRKMTETTPGTWMARYWDSELWKQHYIMLGSLEDKPVGERFKEATRLANEWFSHLAQGGSAAPYTVEQACRDYVKHLHREKGEAAAKDAEARFVRRVYSTKLADVLLSRLKRDHFRDFRTELVNLPVSASEETRERAKDTVNRDLSPLRAAMNLALADGRVSTDFAWREYLKPLKNASRRREIYLDIDQRRKMIEKAAPDIATFIRGMSVLPLRPGALAALVVGDFDKKLKTLHVGKDKNGAFRALTLPPSAADFLQEIASDRPDHEPLFCRADGMAWNKDSWKGPVKDAVEAAGLPAGTTAYSLRHSCITTLVASGLDLLTVAQISGTSVAMIERHYGHLQGHAAKAALSKLHL